MAGRAKTTSENSSGSAQAWANPYAKAGASSAQDVFDQAQPGLHNLTDITQNSLVPSMVGKFNSGLAGSGQAQAHWQRLLGGTQGNPYLDQIIGRTNRNTTDAVNSQFSQGGRYGSGAYTGVLADSLAGNEGNLRYQDYGNQTARQDAAAASLTDSNQADYKNALAGIGVGAELPYTGSTNLANSLGALFAGGTEKTKTKGPGIGHALLGAAGQVGAAFASRCDMRLKENVAMHHIEADGLPVYNFTYRNDMGLPEGEHTMPMAQDVAVYRPWALGPVVDGYMTIYPDKL